MFNFSRCRRFAPLCVSSFVRVSRFAATVVFLFLIALFLIAKGAVAANGGSEAATDDRKVVLDQNEPRPFHEIQADMRAFLRRESVAQDESDKVAAILDLCALYEELKRDPRLAESPTLETYRLKIRSRLISFQSKLEKRQARAERLARRQGDSFDPVLMQQAGRTTSDLAIQISLVGQTLGGPAQVFSQAGGAYGGGVGDYGDDLVNLIENTIAPEFWDTVGGPGTIMYYRPLYALVVRATSEVHHSIGGTLGALRAAGN